MDLYVRSVMRISIESQVLIIYRVFAQIFIIKAKITFVNFVTLFKNVESVKILILVKSATIKTTGLLQMIIHVFANLVI